MRDNYDFSDAVRNPFAEKAKGKFTVTVHYDFTASNDKTSESEQSIDEEIESKRKVGHELAG
jgi:hypothetical protein